MQLILQLNKQNNHTGRPTLIEVKTVIGFGSPNKSGKADSHGAPLGTDEVTLTKAAYDWGHEPFANSCKKYMIHSKQQQKYKVYKQKLNGMKNLKAYKAEFPELADTIRERNEQRITRRF